MAVQGFFEKVERHVALGWIARGWAVDPSAPNDRVGLILAHQDGALLECLADLPRTDPPAATLGDGRHGFAVQLPPAVLDDQPHMLQFIVARTGAPLPRQCPAIFHPPRLHGQVLTLEPGSIHGWAYDERAPERPVVVTISVDGRDVATVTCDRLVDNLGRLLGTSGHHGFSHPFDAGMFTGQPRRIDVRFANSERSLRGAPVSVSWDETSLTSERRRLDGSLAEARATLTLATDALIREPVNQLTDAATYARWLVGHEREIARRLAAINPVSATMIAVFDVPTAADWREFAALVLASTADAIVLLSPGDRLHPAFIPLVAAAFAREAGMVDLVHTDGDFITTTGERARPLFKPDWDPDQWLAQPLVGHACAIATPLTKRAAELVAASEAPADALAWARAIVDVAVLEVAPDRARHTPLALYHHGEASGGPMALMGPERVARVQAHLDRRGASAQAIPMRRGRIWARWVSPEPAPVTVIIPTRDRVDLLRPCVEGLSHRTRHPAMSLAIIDNNSQDPETLAYLDQLAERPDVQLFRWPGAFNYAAMHNMVVAAIETPLVALLNNDIEVMAPDWLSEMTGHACRPEVGAVGAKLLYPNGMIQHGGVLVGQLGVADHALRAYSGEEEGYWAAAQVTRCVSAVTAACLVCRRADWLAVGGMDAENLPVSFNDVDLCLKLRALGRRIIWTPRATLIHHESATRRVRREAGLDERTRREAAYLRAKWGTDRWIDPFYGPNLGRGLQTHVEFAWETGGV